MFTSKSVEPVIAVDRIGEKVFVGKEARGFYARGEVL
jgi:hypothetical protein